MLKRVCAAVLVLTALFSAIRESSFAEPAANVKAAFVRGGDLWVKSNAGEERITKEGKVSDPRWSQDGRWLAYTQAAVQQQLYDLWVYDARTKQRHRISQRFEWIHYAWSPQADMLAFQRDRILNVVDLDREGNFHVENTAFGVNQFSWLPDGSGFLASSTAHSQPEGWSNPVIYKIPWNAAGDPRKSKKFFNIPKTISVGESSILSIGTSEFKWSSERKWIAFIVHPTASWSADHNMLCVLSSDGKRFMPLDEMLERDNWFQWSPSSSRIGYTRGAGRVAYHNKRFAIKDLKARTTSVWTPTGDADTDFTWVNDDRIVVSRRKESPWTSEPEKIKRPFLVQIQPAYRQQLKLTSPPSGKGDSYPRYLPNSRKLTWVRTDGQTAADVYAANANGRDALLWIPGIDIAPSYYGQENWDAVIDLHEQT